MAVNTTITREVSFDAGHRLIHQGGQCANLHGHRFRVEATVSGKVNPATGQPDEGMVLDFAQVKAALSTIASELDHAFIADARDEEIIALCRKSGWRLVVMDQPPTAENIALRFLNGLSDLLAQWNVEQVRIWETPNNSAVVRRVPVSGP